MSPVGENHAIGGPRSLSRVSAWFNYFILLGLRALRFRQFTTPLRMLGLRLSIPSVSQCVRLFREVFISEHYWFSCQDATPLIIDAGANVGITSLYFKSLYPNATVVSFEPDPTSFRFLEQNVEDNRLQGVQSHDAALGKAEGTGELFVRTDIAGGDIGASMDRQYRLVSHPSAAITALPIPVTRLSLHVDRPVSMLKLDIEGAEADVIDELGSRLALVQRISMEYHFLPADQNRLSRILAALEAHGHVYEIRGSRGSHRRSIDRHSTLLIRSERIPRE